MTILHVTNFHFNKRWFDWLPDHAPAHDLLVMSGDMLNLSDVASHPKQIAWVSDWINDYPRPRCVCSGNHILLATEDMSCQLVTAREHETIKNREAARTRVATEDGCVAAAVA